MQTHRKLGAAVLATAALTPFASAAAIAAERVSPSDGVPTAPQAATPQKADAPQLVRQALEAEAAGDLERRQQLLSVARQADPNYAPARWQSGEVRVGEQWLSSEAAATENQWSGKFTAYRQMRDRLPQTADAHLKIARWCNDAGLKDQEKLHLLCALELGPNKGQRHEVMTKLDLVRYQKTIMPAARAEALKKQTRETETALQTWKPRLNRLREDLESKDKARQESAREQLAHLNDVAAIPALELVFAKAKPEAGCAAIAALVNLKQQAGTDSLVRHAVYAAHEDVRKAAAEALRSRDIFSYVPMLLSGMGTPIEINFSAFAFEGGAFGERLTLFREGPLSSTSLTSQGVALPAGVPTPGQPQISLTGRAEQSIAQRAANDAAIALAAVQENARTEEMNKRIGAVLRTATGNDALDDDARQWWDWWSAYNETHYAVDKPTYEFNRYAYTYCASAAVTVPTVEPAPLPRSHYSCFVAGTPVWTITGPVPIETVRNGDWVLSQNVDTGELTYKPVSATTVGTPLPLIEIRVGGETIRATYGHLFWVSGKGWKMAKELSANDRLHTTRGALAIESVEMTGEAACHNLIVPEFNTYFVTDQQLLVHDIDIRGPTAATVPGLVGD